MSLPPPSILIKRKRTDDPVEFLRVYEADLKRRRGDSRDTANFVFSRQQSHLEAGNASSNHLPPPQAVRPVKAIHRAASNRNLAARSNQPRIGLESPDKQFLELTGETTGNRTEAPEPIISTSLPQHVLGQQNGMQNGSSSSRIETGVQVAQPRRFHISRTQSSTSSNPHASANGPPGRKRASKSEPTVFVERRFRQRNPTKYGMPLPNKNGHTAESGTTSSPKGKENPERPQKRPGLIARTSVTASKDSNVPQNSQPSGLATSARNSRLPSGLEMPWDVNSDQLLAEMEAYTLQEIGRNLAEAQTSNSTDTFTPTSGPRKGQNSRFKPKKPTLRYPERHPEQNKVVDQDGEMDVDEPFSDPDDMDDDDDYIIDTYIRMPADALESSNDPKDFGLLVLDSQPDIDEFYREDSDYDEEEEDEEEDENAENHYSADYPDEEVESDDEYGRNPYLYHNYHASDTENFDEDDAEFSDENDSTKYPWSKNPWITSHTEDL